MNSRYLGTKLRQKRFFSAASKAKSPMDEVRELLATTILAHVPVRNLTPNMQNFVFLNCDCKRKLEMKCFVFSGKKLQF